MYAVYIYDRNMVDQSIINDQMLKWAMTKSCSLHYLS